MTTQTDKKPKATTDDTTKPATSLPKDRLAKLRDAANKRDLGEKFYTIVATCW